MHSLQNVMIANSESVRSVKHWTSCYHTLGLRGAYITAAGAADDQHIFDLNVRLQYSDDAAVLLQALQVSSCGHAT